MRLFAVCVGGKNMVATKGNKRKSRNFYYRFVGYSGVEFIKKTKDAHSCPTKENAEFLVRYLQKRIEEVGFMLRNE
jgi:hypothetical protein